MSRRVVITGIGTISPLGLTTPDTWKAALAGTSGISRVTRFDASQLSAQIAGEVKNFDPKNYIDHKEVKKLDFFSQYTLAAAREAWESAKLSTHSYSPARMGCVLGIGLGGLPVFEKFHQIYLAEGARKLSPFLIPSMISNLAPGHVAMAYGLKGVNFVVTSACASSTHALGEAYRMIKNGIQDLVVSGGAESTVTPLGMGGFCAMRALSTRNDAPEKASRPFDKDRDGFVLGEGASLLVLEDMESAVKRGATLIAEVIGYGASCDAHHITAPSPDGEGARTCMSLALKDAGLQPEQVNYINAHGTSTPANDASETAAIKQVFGDWAKNGLVVSSTKSMTGHLLGAAGAIEATFSALAIRDGMVPPTINLDNPDEACDLDYVPHTARKMKVSVALSNSFGFGGTNGSIVLSQVR